MTRDTESVDEIVFECDLDESPDKVWRALTERELLDIWMLDDDAKRESPSERRSTELEILKAEPHRLLRYACRECEKEAANDDGERRVVESIVTFELARNATGGTHLRLVHSDFRITTEAPHYETVCAIASARIRRAKKTQIVSWLVTPQAWREAA